MNRILVVDDDLDLCELLAKYLRREGLEVDMVHDGSLGVERALSGDYALVVLDVMMPGLNGFDALSSIRSKSSLPVLMLTARGDDVDRIMGLEMGPTTTCRNHAIENVVRNAVSYTAEGTDVEVSLRREDDGEQSQAIISVLDHGAGVPQAALADIFRPFYRVADARDRQSGGIGLGLSISQHAVELHGGKVAASNAPARDS